MTGPNEHGTDEQGPQQSRLTLTPASAIVMRPVRWLWSDRIPAGAITLVPGREGIGKSLMLAWLAAHITRGTLPGQYEGSRRSVVYAASEDSWAHTIAPRLHAAGADLDMVYRVEVERDGATTQLTLPRDCESLAVEIERQGVALLAADPLLSLISAGIDNHRDRDLRTALEPLVQLADTTGLRRGRSRALQQVRKRGCAEPHHRLAGLLCGRSGRHGGRPGQRGR